MALLFLLIEQLAHRVSHSFVSPQSQCMKKILVFYLLDTHIPLSVHVKGKGSKFIAVPIIYGRVLYREATRSIMHLIPRLPGAWEAAAAQSNG